MKKRLDPDRVTIDGVNYYIYRFSAFECANLMGDLSKIASPIIGAIVPCLLYTSWTTSDKIVDQILAYRSGLGEECETKAEVILKCKSKTGVNIENISAMNQSEVLFSKNAQFIVCLLYTSRCV